jgi:iron complex transport system substrate-binding protein
MSLSMFRWRPMLALLVVAALLVAALPQYQQVAAQAPANPLECVAEGQYDPATDYFPTKAEVNYAAGFAVEYFNNYKVVRVLAPWPSATETFTYVLTQCGTPTPTDIAYRDAQFIEVPINSFAMLSTTVMPHAEMLEALEGLVAVDSADFTNINAISQGAADGEVAVVGSGPTIDLEKIALAAPSVIFAFGSGLAEYDTHPKLLEADYKVALVGDWAETTPLGRAEWLKFTAVFLNKEAEASALFDDQIVKEYTKMADLAATAEKKPSVLMNVPYEGTWFMPGGQSFQAALIRAAGGTYAWDADQSAGSLPLDIEAVFAKAGEADYWLNTGIDSLEGIKAVDERLANFSAFKSGKVFSNSAIVNEKGGNAYFEMGVVRPDLVLADMISILHPELLPDHTLMFYVQAK